MTRPGGPSDPARPSGGVTPLELDLAAGWKAVTTPRTRATLESAVLPQYLPRQRWFGAKSRVIRRCRINDWVALTPDSGLVFCTVWTGEAEADAATYVVPVAIAAGADAQRIGRTAPHAILGPVAS
jgi:maltose alpha-D-glucosyltransferase/alpha-amylase